MLLASLCERALATQTGLVLGGARALECELSLESVAACFPLARLYPLLAGSSRSRAEPWERGRTLTSVEEKPLFVAQIRGQVACVCLFVRSFVDEGSSSIRPIIISDTRLRFSP